MRRNNITATAMHLTSSRIHNFANKINTGNINVLREIDLPSHTHTMHYIEDSTEEVRDVTCIDFGCPVQLSVCFYK